MAAVARKEQLEKVRPDSGCPRASEGRILSRNSRQGAHPAPHHSSNHARRVSRAQAQPEELEELEDAPHNAREYLDEMREEAHPDVVPATRRRNRRAHRDLRFSLPITLACVALFVQLLWLIWVKSLASAASHQANKLDVKIAQMQDDIARAQKKISATTSTVQLEAWSKQLGLRLATQGDIDPVSRATKPRDAKIAIIATETQTENVEAKDVKPDE